jgi:protein CpxP
LISQSCFWQRFYFIPHPSSFIPLLYHPKNLGHLYEAFLLRKRLGSGQTNGEKPMQLQLKLKLIALAAGTVLSLTTLTPSLTRAQTEAFPVLEGLELTQQQRTQLDELQQQTRAQLEEILTEEQREQFMTTLSEEQNLRRAIAALNLTDPQKEQLRPVFQSVRTQISDILTPEQRQQLRDNIRTVVQERQQ